MEVTEEAVGDVSVRPLLFEVGKADRGISLETAAGGLELSRVAVDGGSRFSDKDVRYSGFYERRSG